MHSKAKLALGVLTSPGAAFEEITSRKLLGTAVTIVALTGTVSALHTLMQASSMGPLALFGIGKNNPLAWVGLCMLYAFFIQKLLNWVGTDIDYVNVLTVMGWSQVALLIAYTIGLLLTVTGFGAHSPQIASMLSALATLLVIWYIGLIGMGIRTIADAPLSRGIMSYIVIALAAYIAFGHTYGTARMGPFSGALEGIKSTAGNIASYDHIAWLAAAVAGLILGLVQIAKFMEWDAGTRNRAIASAAVFGLAVLGIYTYSITKADYYGKLIRAQQLYNNDRYSESARHLTALLPIAKNNINLMLEIADLYYLDGNGEKSIDNYNRAARVAKQSSSPQKKMELARIATGIGAVYDFEKKYDPAIKEFRKATKLWPEFRDPWVRMAVTYDRMGDYKKALDTGNEHALKKLDSDATVAWVAVAEAFVRTGDKKQSAVAIAKVQDGDKALADRIGEKPEDWKDAVSKLTRQNLKYPLEEQPAPPPSRGAKKQEAGKK